MQGWEEALALLPEPMRTAARQQDRPEAEEIRLRLGQAPTLLSGGKEAVFCEKRVTGEQLYRILEKASGASLHTVLGALREGYLSCRGLRLGVCGLASCGESGIEGFRHITSLAIRIPHELPGLCRPWFSALYPEGFRNTVILSPPGGGKTTALRDLIRELSDRGWRVAVADERNELSASDEGGVRFALGAHSDVMAGVPKWEAAELLLRSMNPQILAMDEIGSADDARILERLCCSGVGILASCHADSVDSLRRSPLFSVLAEKGLFACALVIRREYGRREYTVERVGT